jgi:DNA-directed RNA polymerase specialized sigma24 family protein
MEDQRNSLDIALLESDPHELILRYQETIGIIVKSYIRSGMFHSGEFNDIVQQINRELLEKLARIRRQYNGTSLFRTYLSNIIRHSCLDLHKKRLSEPAFLDVELSRIPLESDSIEAKLLIEHDILTFRAIIEQFHSEKFKLLLCLKLMYGIPIHRQDVLQWWPACPEKDLMALVVATDEGVKKQTYGRAFERLRPISNKAEKNSSPADSIRRWTDERILKILDLLNGSPPTSAHNRETLGILLEDFFAPFLLKR